MRRPTPAFPSAPRWIDDERRRPCVRWRSRSCPVVKTVHENVISQPTCRLPELNAESLELVSTYYQWSGEHEAGSALPHLSHRRLVGQQQVKEPTEPSGTRPDS
jgi:hypothetical protein